MGNLEHKEVPAHIPEVNVEKQHGLCAGNKQLPVKVITGDSENAPHKVQVNLTRLSCKMCYLPKCKGCFVHSKRNSE